MSLTLLFDQTDQPLPKRPSGAELQGLFAPACHLGSVGPNFSFREGLPEAEEGGETIYMLYGRQRPLGRGFCLFVSEDSALFRIVTPLPTTGHDLDDVFTATVLLGRYLGAKEFQTEERQSFPLEGAAVFRDEMKGDNCLMVKDFADERPGFAVSGVHYPLHMTEDFCLQLAALDPPAAEQAFSQCLAEKQAPGYYYLNPNFYRNTDTGEAIAVYALSEGVDSIIPKEPFIPYGAGPFGDDPVNTWRVALIHSGGGAEVLGTISYLDFLSRLHEEEKELFDDVHYLLRGLSLPRLQELAAGARPGL